MRQAVNTATFIMKKLFLLPLLFPLMIAAQDCEPFLGTFSIAWGAGTKQTKSVHVEAGIWGTSKPFTLSLGLTAGTYGNSEAKNDFGQGISEPFMGIYLRLGIISVRSNDRRFFNVGSITVSGNPGLTYAVYYKPFQNNNILVGVMPYHYFRSGISGAWLQIKLGVKY